MSDQTSESETQNPEGGNPEQNTQEEKKFTQKELDSLIQNRLKREKDTFNASQATWNQEKDGYEQRITQYETHLKELIGYQAEGLSETEKILFDKLSVADQLDFLKNVPKTDKKIPKTPKPEGSLEVNERKFPKRF